MIQPKTFELAHERNTLWPPIADALDTFDRRKTRGMSGYERVWRLIHVWESIEVTLAPSPSAAFERMTRFKMSIAGGVRHATANHGTRWTRLSNRYKEL